jgi:glycerol transport system ATP-binding protein
MIYVTHDQTEALTFADQVIVMNLGVVVQSGTPVDLFERPMHTFVGHFIGSPGMNVLPASYEGGVARFAGQQVPLGRVPQAAVPSSAKLEIGVRPEFVRFAADGIPVRVAKVRDGGRFRIVDAMHEAQTIRLLVGEGEEVPGEQGFVRFEPAHTRLYADGWAVQ